MPGNQVDKPGRGLKGSARPPKDKTVYSNNGQYLASSSVKKNETRVYRSPGKKKDFLWMLPGWHRSFFVSDDGNYCVAGFDGFGLLPLDYDKEKSGTCSKSRRSRER